MSRKNDKSTKNKPQATSQAMTHHNPTVDSFVSSLTQNQLAAISSLAHSNPEALHSLAFPVPSLPPLVTPAPKAHPTLATAPPKQVPAFLSKLYSMVNDPSTDDYIHWSENGTTFIVERIDEFARVVLPKFFKHSNFSSFNRQLNMYGFHKVPSLQQGALINTEQDTSEFENEFFQRNQPDLLLLVSRKKSSKGDEDKPDALDIHNVISDIAAIKRHQQAISHEINSLQSENQLLWQECIFMRDKYTRQQQTVDKILRFLASIFQKKSQNITASKKRRYLLGDVKTDDNEHVSKKIKELLSPSEEQAKSAGIKTIPPTALITQSAPEKVLNTKTDNLMQNAQELNTDIELLEDQLYGIYGSLGLDLDQLKNNSSEDESELFEIFNENKNATTSVPFLRDLSSGPESSRKTSRQDDSEPKLPDPAVFFDPDANLSTLKEDAEDEQNVEFSIEDFLEE